MVKIDAKLSDIISLAHKNLFDYVMSNETLCKSLLQDVGKGQRGETALFSKRQTICWHTGFDRGGLGACVCRIAKGESAPWAENKKNDDKHHIKKNDSLASCQNQASHSKSPTITTSQAEHTQIATYAIIGERS